MAQVGDDPRLPVIPPDSGVCGRYRGCYCVSPSVFGSGEPSGSTRCSRVFAKEGYRVALIARNADHLNKFTAELKEGGTEVSLVWHSV